MTFFIPDRTLCSICEQPLAHRWHAAQLPYADPAVVGELARMGRRYVHRACWNAWRDRDAYATSALALRSRDPGTVADAAVVDRDATLFWHEVPALGTFRLEDLHVLFTLEIPTGDACRLAGSLREAASAVGVSELAAGGELWRLRREGSRIEVARSCNGELLELADVPFERYLRWVEAVRAMCDRATRRPADPSPRGGSE